MAFLLHISKVNVFFSVPKIGSTAYVEMPAVLLQTCTGWESHMNHFLCITSQQTVSHKDKKVLAECSLSLILYFTKCFSTTLDSLIADAACSGRQKPICS